MGESKSVSRRSFIKSSATVAAGSAAVATPAALIASDQHKAAEAVEPSAATPSEPVMAYLRDEQRGEVTVVAGTTETTYRDRVLAQRLSAAARAQTAGGETDVLAP